MRGIQEVSEIQHGETSAHERGGGPDWQASVATQIQICAPDKQLHPLEHQQRDDQTATRPHITTTSRVAALAKSQASPAAPHHMGDTPKTCSILGCMKMARR